MEAKSIYQILFKDKIGKEVSVRVEGEYYMGSYINSNFDSGKLTHVGANDDGSIYFQLDNKRKVCIDLHNSKIKFYD